MINNNTDMILSMKDMEDYEEYVSLCKEKEIPYSEVAGFSYGIFMLKRGMRKHPELSPQEAYLKIIHETDKRKENNEPVTPKKGCCGNKKDKPLPPISKRVKNYVEAKFEHIVAGKPLVDVDEFLRRISICKKCDSFNADYHCAECGCPMNIKATWSEQNCSLEKWGG